MKTYNFIEARDFLTSLLSKRVKGIIGKDLEQLSHFALKYHAKINGHPYNVDHEYNSRDIKIVYHRILFDYLVS